MHFSSIHQPKCDILWLLYQLLYVIMTIPVQNDHLRTTVPARFDHLQIRSIKAKKTPKMPFFPIFHVQGLRLTFLYFPKLFSMGFLAIPAKIWPKWQKVEISAFLDDFQKNGSRLAKNGPRNPWDVSNGHFQATFSPHKIKIYFWKSVPEISPFVLTSSLNVMKISFHKF